jgi:hypothetical protein
MIVSIHQPNYFPYYGYFNKIKHCDTFVFLDNVTYSKNSYINRNRIKTCDGVKWLTVPVVNKNILNKEIKDVEISGEKWKKDHLKTLEYNYNKTLKYYPIHDILTDIYNRDWKNLSELNIYVINSLCNYLQIDTKFVRASELGVSGKSTELLLNICKKLKADTYLAGSSGKNYMDEKIFTDNNIDIKHQSFTHPMYNQKYGEFVENLSMLDAVFNGVSISWRK